jgi:predicted PurR-regulated permease PerM
LLYQGEETMKRPILIILSVVVAFVLVGSLLMTLFGPRIGQTFSSVSYELPGYGGGAPQYALPPEAPAYDALGAPLPPSEEVYRSATVQTQERLVIQNADLAIVVADPKTRMTEIANMANEMGGFVVSSNIYTTYYGVNSVEAPAANIVIRVPSERLDEALEKIKEGAVDVDYENRTGQDVTSIYVDLQSQLKAKQAAEKQLLEIMEDATETEAVLAVYTQLQIIQSEIEVLKGQIKYYDESVALSAVNVTLIAEETVQPVEIGGWKLQGTANDAIQDLIYFTQGFVQFLIRLFLSVIPSLILMAIPLYLAFLGGRGLYRRFNKSKAVADVKEEKKK